MLAPHLAFVNETMNGIFHPCPFNSIDVYNVTFSFNGDENLEKVIFPNGENKFVINLYNNRIKKIMYVYGFVDIVQFSQEKYVEILLCELKHELIHISHRALH